MPNPAISREDVHRIAESCSAAGEAFRASAMRIARDQRPLVNFLKSNFGQLNPHSAEVTLYMLTVSLRIFTEYGGRLNKVNASAAQAAAARISRSIDALLPFDNELPGRVRQIEWRAQPHLLDEILWALYEKQDKAEDEISLPPEQSALVFLLLWACVEAIDESWVPPRS
ncbi:hypothetical protein L6R49_05150 [Myxococcota bacterium]|nr:hypothetical protein [Myxococcota bacterium]